MITETTDKPEFELADGCDSSIVAKGEGSASFQNEKEQKIMILHYEKFINQFGPGRNAGKGKKCDYLLMDEGNTLLFNELSCGQEEYLEGNGGKIGKREMAKEQLTASIDRVICVPSIATYIESFSNRVALFSYRMNDIEHVGSVIGESVRMFQSPLMQYPQLESVEPIGEFKFIQQIYPQKYRL